MLKKVVIYTTVILLFVTKIVFAPYDKETLQNLNTEEIQSLSTTDVGDNINNLEELGKINDLKPEQIAPHIHKLSDKGFSQLSKDQLAYKDPSGTPNINKVSDWNKLNKDARDPALSQIVGKSIVTDSSTNGKVVGNGVQFDSIKTLKVDKTSLTNGVGVVYDGNKLNFKHADSVMTDKSATTDVDNFEGYGDIFSVEKADSFLSDCIRVDNIKDSEFKVSNKVEITTKSDVGLKITDCSYNEFEFKGKGKVSVDKNGNNPAYTVENGTLTKKENGYNESVESINSIIIETDKTFGFKCLTITPVGSYFYNDNDLRKDFIVNIPKESSVYKLCLRKNKAQFFSNYNGLVDFVDKKIELNGIVNYLRYPIKNNQISSLLSDFVYKGLKDVKTLLTYDRDLLFLNNAEIKNILQNKQQIAITKPNNYYNVKEIELEDGKIHRIVELNPINKNQLTQDIASNYESDSLKPKIKIINNVLIQDNGKNSITFLPPEHEKINQILK